MTPQAGHEAATLGGGCFWCIEGALRHVNGVTRVESGYAGGHLPNPTYEQVCGKQTGHAEVVRVVFDPAELSYADLLRVLFPIHDPTPRDRQGADVGPQYRSAIFTHSDTQAATARDIVAEIGQAGIYDRPVVTELLPEARFWPAEAEHHDYFARNPWSGYCQAVVAPKVVKFRKVFADRVKRTAA